MTILEHSMRRWWSRSRRSLYSGGGGGAGGAVFCTVEVEEFSHSGGGGGGGGAIFCTVAGLIPHKHEWPDCPHFNRGSLHNCALCTVHNTQCKVHSDVFCSAVNSLHYCDVQCSAQYTVLCCAVQCRA